MYKFVDLQNQVKRAATKDQGGSTFDTWIKDVINESLFTVARDSYWRQLRRRTYFNTVGDYTTGTVAVSASGTTWTGSGTAFLSNLQVGRRFQTTGTGGSSLIFTIATITSDTSLTTTTAFDGASSYSGTWKVFGQFEYNLPAQLGRIGNLNHEKYGYTLRLQYSTDFDYYNANLAERYSYIPLVYREWGMDMVLEQPKADSVISVYSTFSSTPTTDSNISITIFGTVSGYPDSETIITDPMNASTPVAGTKSFTTVERVSKSASSTGRIIVTANSANTTVAIIPSGNTMAGLLYKKIQLWPYPATAFPIYVEYYKDPARLVNDNDIHELGTEFDQAIVLLATARVKSEQSQLEDGKVFMALYENDLKSLRRVNTDKADYLPTLKRAQETNTRIPLISPFLNFAQAGGQYGPSYRL